MKRALIILGGEESPAEFVKERSKEADFVLCADSGLDLALKSDIHIDAVIGDFDSANEESLHLMKRKKIPYIQYPTIKDDTDGMACVRYVLEREVEEVQFIGATGGRIDHYLANFQLLVYLEKHHVRASIQEPDMIIQAVHNRSQLISGNVNDTISVLQMSEELELSESGVFYTLDHYNVEFGYPIGVSNVMTSQESTITVHKGWGLIIHYTN